ncbi:MAG: type II toxin-antitoxin system prevent-host-death family antitoxin [Thermomicrobiales bacterium]
MTQVGIKELKAQASAIVRRVEEDGDTIDITRRGRVVAHVIPAKKKLDRRRIEEVLAERDKLIAELSGGWPQGVSAAEAVAQDRREL